MKNVRKLLEMKKNVCVVNVFVDKFFIMWNKRRLVMEILIVLVFMLVWGSIGLVSGKIGGDVN